MKRFESPLRVPSGFFTPVIQSGLIDAIGRAISVQTGYGGLDSKGRAVLGIRLTSERTCPPSEKIVQARAPRDFADFRTGLGRKFCSGTDGQRDFFNQIPLKKQSLLKKISIKARLIRFSFSGRVAIAIEIFLPGSG